MDPVTVLGNVALVFTIACNFSPLPICVGFFKKKSTKNFSVTPFVVNATCNALWLQYSALMGDNTLILLNCVTLFLQASYVACFYANTTEKGKVVKLSLLVTGFLLSMHFYGRNTDAASAKTVLGLAASAASILACAAPFENLAEVIRTQSSETLPGPIIIGAFIVTTMWCIYGVLVGDTYIQVPNGIGAFFCAIQLVLIGIYPAKPSSLKKEE